MSAARAANARPAGAADWITDRERGSVTLIALTIRLALLVGRAPMKLVVALIALWYACFDRKARAASRRWLERVRGRPAAFGEVVRHLRNFAQVTLDRAFLLSGRHAGLRFTRTGDELLARQFATGRGAVLLGAHLGSYEAMCAGGVQDGVPINIVGHFRNARMINALLTRLAPGAQARIISLADDPVGVMASVRARVEAGELVAVMGDRVGLNERIVLAPFFGHPAAFAAGPYLIAHLLQCPVYLVFGLYTAPGRYDLYCEPFAERIDLPRRGRDAELARWVARYAERLEHYARRAPDNWFNFYDFWSEA
jgi:predicted LPLAT superfamily acyltransferase